MVDSSDVDRVQEAKEVRHPFLPSQPSSPILTHQICCIKELHGLLEEVDTTDTILLVYANKQDVAGAIPVNKVRPHSNPHQSSLIGYGHIFSSHGPLQYASGHL